MNEIGISQTQGNSQVSVKWDNGLMNSILDTLKKSCSELDVNKGYDRVLFKNAIKQIFGIAAVSGYIPSYEMLCHDSEDTYSNHRYFDIYVSVPNRNRIQIVLSGNRK